MLLICIGSTACPKVTNPSKGHVFRAVKPTGDVATYGCQEAYRIKGHFTSVCDPLTGKWSDPAPTCVQGAAIVEAGTVFQIV